MATTHPTHTLAHTHKYMRVSGIVKWAATYGPTKMDEGREEWRGAEGSAFSKQ